MAPLFLRLLHSIAVGRLPGGAGLRSALCALLACHLAGCATSDRSATTAEGLDLAIASYEAGHYATARQEAEAVHASRPGPLAAEAAYIVGLCAYQLGDLGTAEARFNEATVAKDPEVAAKARAGLGLVRLHEGQPRAAAACFEQAYPDLDEADAADAARHAERAYREAGDWTAARAWNERGRAPDRAADSPAANSQLAAADPASGFSLQVGAFEDRPRAERAAAAATGAHRHAGVGSARVIPRSTGNGQTLFVVQIGRFPTRGDAARVRDRLGRPQYIVAERAD